MKTMENLDQSTKTDTITGVDLNIMSSGILSPSRIDPLQSSMPLKKRKTSDCNDDIKIPNKLIKLKDITISTVHNKRKDTSNMCNSNSLDTGEKVSSLFDTNSKSTENENISPHKIDKLLTNSNISISRIPANIATSAICSKSNKSKRTPMKIKEHKQSTNFNTPVSNKITSVDIDGAESQKKIKIKTNIISPVDSKSAPKKSTKKQPFIEKDSLLNGNSINKELSNAGETIKEIKNKSSKSTASTKTSKKSKIKYTSIENPDDSFKSDSCIKTPPSKRRSRKKQSPSEENNIPAEGNVLEAIVINPTKENKPSKEKKTKKHKITKTSRKNSSPKTALIEETDDSMNKKTKKRKRSPKKNKKEDKCEITDENSSIQLRDSAIKKSCDTIKSPPFKKKKVSFSEPKSPVKLKNNLKPNKSSMSEDFEIILPSQSDAIESTDDEKIPKKRKFRSPKTETSSDNESPVKGRASKRKEKKRRIKKIRVKPSADLYTDGGEFSDSALDRSFEDLQSKTTKRYAVTGKWYVAAGYLKDFTKLMNTFGQFEGSRFKDFSKAWQELEFSLIYRGRQTSKELLEFSDEISLLTKRFLVAPHPDKRRICALYTLYGLYYKHPIRHFYKIRLELSEFKQVMELVFVFYYQFKNPDPAYIFFKLKNDGAFHYTLTSTECCLEFHKDEREQEECQYRQQKLAHASKVNHALPNDYVKSTSKLLQHYYNIKNAISENTDGPERALNMVDQSADSKVHELLHQLKQETWKELGLVKKELLNHTGMMSDIGIRRLETRERAGFNKSKLVKQESREIFKSSKLPCNTEEISEEDRKFMTPIAVDSVQRLPQENPNHEGLFLSTRTRFNKAASRPEVLRKALSVKPTLVVNYKQKVQEVENNSKVTEKFIISKLVENESDLDDEEIVLKLDTEDTTIIQAAESDDNLSDLSTLKIKIYIKSNSELTNFITKSVNVLVSAHTWMNIKYNLCTIQHFKRHIISKYLVKAKLESQFSPKECSVLFEKFIEKEKEKPESLLLEFCDDEIFETPQNVSAKNKKRLLAAGTLNMKTKDPKNLKLTESIRSLSSLHYKNLKTEHSNYYIPLVLRKKMLNVFKPMYQANPLNFPDNSFNYSFDWRNNYNKHNAMKKINIGQVQSLNKSSVPYKSIQADKLKLTETIDNIKEEYSANDKIELIDHFSDKQTNYRNIKQELGIQRSSVLCELENDWDDGNNDIDITLQPNDSTNCSLYKDELTLFQSPVDDFTDHHNFNDSANDDIHYQSEDDTEGHYENVNDDGHYESDDDDDAHSYVEEHIPHKIIQTNSGVQNNAGVAVYPEFSLVTITDGVEKLIPIPKGYIQDNYDVYNEYPPPPPSYSTDGAYYQYLPVNNTLLPAETSNSYMANTGISSFTNSPHNSLNINSQVKNVSSDLQMQSISEVQLLEPVSEVEIVEPYPPQGNIGPISNVKFVGSIPQNNIGTISEENVDNYSISTSKQYILPHDVVFKTPMQNNECIDEKEEQVENLDLFESKPTPKTTITPKRTVCPVLFSNQFKFLSKIKQSNGEATGKPSSKDSLKGSTPRVKFLFNGMFKKKR